MLLGGCFRGPELGVGPSFPATVPPEQVRGLLEEGGVEPPPLPPPPTQRTAILLTQEFCSQKRQKEFPKVMGPVPHAHSQAECQEPARLVGRWGRAQGKGLQLGAGRNDREISSPAQLLAQAGFSGGSSHGQRHLEVVGWPSAQQTQKTNLSTCRLLPPQG